MSREVYPDPRPFYHRRRFAIIASSDEGGYLSDSEASSETSPKFTSEIKFSNPQVKKQVLRLLAGREGRICVWVVGKKEMLLNSVRSWFTEKV